MSIDRIAVRSGLGAMLASLVLILLLFPAHHFDPSWFVHFGSEDRVVVEARAILGPDVDVPHVDGHDGRFFWLQARDPLLRQPNIGYPAMDRPAYRAQRMFYPLLAAPFRAFGERALLWALVALNVVAVGVGTAFTSILARRTGAPRRAAAMFLFTPAVLVSVVMDTADAVALAALVGSLAALTVRRPRLAIGLAVAAVLGKEVMLLSFIGAALFARDARLSRRHRIVLVACPALAAAAWSLFLRMRLGFPPSQIEEFVLVPMAGFFDTYRRGWHSVGNYQDMVLALGLIPLAIVVVRRWCRRRTLCLSAALPWVVVVPFFSAQVLDLPVNSLRAVGPAFLLLALDAYAYSKATAGVNLREGPAPASEDAT